MLEFNLLPDIKIKYVRAERIKILVVTISLFVSIVCIAILALMIGYVNFVQKNAINSLNKKITTNISSINKNTELDKILIIQKQARTIPLIQDKLYQTTRLFNYMSELTPSLIKISNLNLDLTKYQISVTGSADSLATVNKFVDTLKFTTYNFTDNGKTINKGLSFSQVVLNSFSYSSNNVPTYSITFVFTPDIFIQKNNINLIVPNITSTRSIIGQPNALFQKGN